MGGTIKRVVSALSGKLKNLKDVLEENVLLQRNQTRHSFTSNFARDVGHLYK